MARRSKTPRGGLSPGKAIVIGILAVVLVFVIVAQFGGKQQRVATPPTARPSARQRSESTTTSTQPAPAPALNRPESVWPTFDVAEIVASNPFVLPEALRPRREAVTNLTSSSEPGEAEESVAAVEPAEAREMRRRQAEFMASLRAKGVDMILRSPRGSVARVGGLSLRVGDVHEGLRVEAIDQDRVVFAPDEIAGRPAE